ncbi:hypothetical protein BDQ17DRAFT_1437678 [Cyathus striatus]|nr:hypothetical protein BDQ17DRAFT_1437678 [Cyathus striatus]
MSTELIDYVPNSYLNINCHSGEFSFNATSDVFMESLDEMGNGVSRYNVLSNPFKAGAEIASMAYYGEDNETYDDFVGK